MQTVLHKGVLLTDAMGRIKVLLTKVVVLSFIIINVLLFGCRNSNIIYEIKGYDSAEYLPNNGSSCFVANDDIFFVNTNLKTTFSREDDYLVEPLIVNIESSSKLMKDFPIKIKGGTSSCWKIFNNNIKKVNIILTIFFENEKLIVNISPYPEKISFNIFDSIILTQEISINYDSIKWNSLLKNGWQYGYFDIYYKYCPIIVADEKFEYASGTSPAKIRINIRRRKK